MKKNPCRKCVYFKSENVVVYPPRVECGRSVSINGVDPEVGCLWFKKAKQEKSPTEKLKNSSLFKGVL